MNLSAIALFLASGMLISGGQAVDKSAATIVVEAVYPGANASTVADTVAAPIEQQINGIENLVRMVSRSSNDGKYTLAITFKPGADLDNAQVLVQNRVALAQPALPDLVTRMGIRVKPRQMPQMLVTLTAQNEKVDPRSLIPIATTNIANELARIPGVETVTQLGPRDYSIRIWIDADKLKARNLKASDVVNAFREQNLLIGNPIGAPPVPKNEPFQFKLDSLGRLHDADDLAKIIVRVEKAQPIRLGDVARIEQGAAGSDSHVGFNGKPGIAFVVNTTAGSKANDVKRAIIERFAKPGESFSKGMRLDVPFDFSQPQPDTQEMLLLDVQLPDAASMERVHSVLTNHAKRLRDMAGVQDVLTLSENPFDLLRNQPCILVRLIPASDRKHSLEEIKSSIRKRFANATDAVMRVRDVLGKDSPVRFDYPLALAIADRGDQGTAKLREVAESFTARLNESKKLTDVSSNQASSSLSTLDLSVDRERAKALGVSMQDIVEVVRLHTGSLYLNDLSLFNRNWQVHLQFDEKSRKNLENLKTAKVRNQQGQMVPLRQLVSLREISSPAAIVRIDGIPAIDITANPAANMSEVEARRFCESLFEIFRKEAGLPDSYRLAWMR